MNNQPFPDDDPFLWGRDAHYETCETCRREHRVDFGCSRPDFTVREFFLWSLATLLVFAAIYGATR